MYLAFHSAEHTRFNHSLGVYEVVRRMTENFKEHEEWEEDDRLLALASALLHDLGHGPFSHCFEKIFHTDHEEYTRKIILGDTDVNAVLKRVSPGFPLQVAQVIDQTHENKLVISMISSQIDADRMDYLQRDSYYTGVIRSIRYGTDTACHAADERRSHHKRKRHACRRRLLDEPLSDVLAGLFPPGIRGGKYC